MLVLGLALAVPGFGAELAGKKPNIIYILADDMGYGDLGCYRVTASGAPREPRQSRGNVARTRERDARGGQKKLATPRIDRMAAQGLRFTRHYAGSTVCAPSRCVLMTGLHTGHCSVRGNSSGAMPASDVTVADVLKDAGYATACIGKWGIGNPPPLDDPNRNGFDYFYGYVNMFHAHNFYPEFLYRNGKKEKLRNVLKERWRAERPVGTGKEGAGVAAQKIDYVPSLLARDVLDYINRRAQKEEPFFLYYALNIPHANNEGGSDPEQRDGMEVPDYGEYAGAEWSNPEKGFAAIMRNIDNDVGAILDTLEELGIAENTLVFFSSDNGPHNEGRHDAEFFDSNGDLRGIKRDLYEGGIRVPLIAWWPGIIEGGRETDHVSAFQDLMPTLAELGGVEEGLPEGIDGISMVPTLAGDRDSQARHEALYWEFQEKGGRQAVIANGWKGIRLETVKNPDGPLELYRLEDDLSEGHDLAGEYPEVVAELAAIMAREHGEEGE